MGLSMRGLTSKPQIKKSRFNDSIRLNLDLILCTRLYESVEGKVHEIILESVIFSCT